MREALFKIVVPLFVIVAAVTSLQMGVVVKGASGLTAAPVGMQVLYACTLFTFGGASLGYPVEGPDAWRLVLYATYFLAPIISATAFFELFYVLSRPILSIDLFVRERYIILGHGRVGRAAQEAVLRRTRRMSGGTGSKAVRLLRKLFFTSWMDCNRTGFIIVDRDVRQSAATVNMFGRNVHFIRYDLHDKALLKRLNLQRSAGVFILTDDEWVNLSLLQGIEELCARKGGRGVWKGPSRIFTRMRSRDHLLFLRGRHQNFSGKGALPRFEFFNTHMEAADRLFADPGNAPDGLPTIHSSAVREAVGHVRAWAASGEVHTWVFFGFGRFCATICERLLDDPAFNAAVRRVIIVDVHATGSFKLFCRDHEHQWTGTLEPGWRMFMDKVTLLDRAMEDLALFEQELAGHDLRSALVVFGTNSQSANFETAVAFMKLFAPLNAGGGGFKLLVRSYDEGAHEPELLDHLVTTIDARHGCATSVIIVPSYAWVSSYFEDRLATEASLHGDR